MRTFPKKQILISHEAMIMGRRVEVSLNTVSSKLVGWYFVKSLICLPFTRHHFGYPGKKYNNYRTCKISDLNLIFVYLPWLIQEMVVVNSKGVGIRGQHFFFRFPTR